MQEVRKLQNQDLRADMAWSINSSKMEANLGDFHFYKLFMVFNTKKYVLLDTDNNHM